MASPAESPADRSVPDTQSRRAALRRQEARVKFWRVAIVSAFFVALMTANLYVGAVMLFGTLQTRKDEARDAASVRTGSITRPLYDGVFCRSLIFDNQRAEIRADKIVRCDEAQPRRRSNTSFSWGKE